jgi:hypothetical protein
LLTGSIEAPLEEALSAAPNLFAPGGMPPGSLDQGGPDYLNQKSLHTAASQFNPPPDLKTGKIIGGKVMMLLERSET